MSRRASFDGAGRLERLEHDVIGRAAGRDVVAQRQLEADEVLEHRGQPRAPRRQVELAQVDAVDLDRAGLRVVQPAQQLGERRLAGAVLSDDGERRAGGDGQVEAFEHGRAARVGKASRRGNGSRARAGRPRDGVPDDSAPAGAIAGSRRSTAATGAAAPSSAQFSPPNAMSDVPTAHCA